MWPSNSDWLQWSATHWWIAFLVVYGAVARAESVYPRRRLIHPLVPRWTRHTCLAALGIGASFAVYQTSAFVLSLHVANSSFGLMNYEAIPLAARIGIAIPLLDLVRYAQHRFYHRLTALWQIHQVHHSDSDFDLTTGFRFHPLEVVLSEGTYLCVIALLAPAPAAVLCVAFLTMAQNLLEHGNFVIPKRVDRALRLIFVTPDMHRIHHSDVVPEQNRNFGTIFSWWDRMFGTYLLSPSSPHGTMGLGIRSIPNGGALGFLAILGLPFRKPARSVPQKMDRVISEHPLVP